MKVYHFSHDYKTLFGVDINLGMSKAERLTFNDSSMTHAMNLTAVTLNVSRWGKKRELIFDFLHFILGIEQPDKVAS